jgi:hypothetical protein
LNGAKAWFAFFRDVWRITGKPVLVVGLMAGLAKVTWDNKQAIEGVVRDLLHTTIGLA